jgi:hypothetical protein
LSGQTLVLPLAERSIVEYIKEESILVSRDKLPGLFPSVKMVYAVEDVFAITLSDSEAASILTVGQLYEHILAKFSSAQQEGCLRSIAFYKFRRALMMCGVSREKVKLNALLSELLPRDNRRKQWSSLRNELGLPLPELRYPHDLDGCLALLAIFAFLLSLPVPLAFDLCGKSLTWSVLTGMYGIPVAIFLVAIVLRKKRDTAPLAVELPRGFETVGSAVEQLVSWNFADLAQRSGRWSPDELFIALQNVTAYICSAQPEEITLDTKFTDLPDFE